MQIKFDINLEQEVEQLTFALECAETDLETVLSLYGCAALKEYIQMLLGQRVVRQVADVKEYKLMLLIKEVFGNKIPNEQKIAQIFQITNSQARTLLKFIMAKYPYELAEAIRSSYIDILTGCKQVEEDGDYEVTIDNVSAVEGLNYILARMDGTLPKITRKVGTVSVYKVNIASCEKLCEKFSVSRNFWSNE